jgi:signal transduction histidine kinase
MLFSQRSRSQNFRYLEWIYMAIHFGMEVSRSDGSLLTSLGFYGVFFCLGWIFPSQRSRQQRILYIVAGLGTTIVARCYDLDLGLFLFFYFAKSYFLLNRRITVALCFFAAIPWTISEYSVEVARIQSPQAGILPSIDLLIGTLATYIAASVFVLMLCTMLLAEERSRYQIAELSEQVESLATSLERTRIAREIHDSLGHTLTDLDTQLAVAQTLRPHDLTRSFQAVDTAKLLARQCIEDVSQALDQMRQSDFDLNQALIGLVEQLRQSSGMQVQWQINLPQCSVYKSYQIYCIAKEALMNVQKHANASQINFNSRLVEDGILLELKDNGSGFDPNQFTTGFGLQGMVERVQLLGGKLDIKTAFAEGTHIQVLLPL